jgi:hypothetical protein
LVGRQCPAESAMGIVCAATRFRCAGSPLIFRNFGGRTRARTWDPLIKSQIFFSRYQ